MLVDRRCVEVNCSPCENVEEEDGEEDECDDVRRIRTCALGGALSTLLPDSRALYLSK